jgi:hypothetical protein
VQINDYPERQSRLVSLSWNSAERRPLNLVWKKSHSGSGKSASPGSTRAQAGAETNEKSDDSQSCPESVEVSAPAIAFVRADASTGSLFDMEPKKCS